MQFDFQMISEWNGSLIDPRGPEGAGTQGAAAGVLCPHAQRISLPQMPTEHCHSQEETDMHPPQLEMQMMSGYNKSKINTSESTRTTVSTQRWCSPICNGCSLTRAIQSHIKLDI